MEAYALALTYAIPIFLSLIGIEAFISWRMGIKINRGADMISSLSSGITNIVKDILGLSIAIVSYAWLVQNVALFHIKNIWYVYVIAFIAKDFAGYWIHRLEHTINFAWNRHIIHHSSEEFNLSCALRQSISEVFSFVSLFLLPAALIGVPTEVIAIIAPIQLFAQFWYHTRLINKMGFLEYIIVTPSHHRVHHAINAEYMDKNFSQIFIVWDKWFGTFQPELPEVPAVYGVKRPVHTWNPFLINFKHIWLLLSDAWYASGWKDKFRVFFMPTGWRPEDVKLTHPVEAIEDVFGIEKYDTFISTRMLGFAWFQMGMLLAFTMYLFMNFAAIGFPGVLLYGLFLMISVFSITSFLDKASYAWIAELLRFAVGIIFIFSSGGDWFKLSSILTSGSYIVGTYLFISLLMVGYFQLNEMKVSPKVDIARSVQ